MPQLCSSLRSLDETSCPLSTTTSTRTLSALHWISPQNFPAPPQKFPYSTRNQLTAANERRLFLFLELSFRKQSRGRNLRNPGYFHGSKNACRIELETPKRRTSSKFGLMTGRGGLVVPRPLLSCVSSPGPAESGEAF